jgi:hypothetical protein
MLFVRVDHAWHLTSSPPKEKPLAIRHMTLSSTSTSNADKTNRNEHPHNKEQMANFCRLNYRRQQTTSLLAERSVIMREDLIRTQSLAARFIGAWHDRRSRRGTREVVKGTSAKWFWNIFF